MADESAFVAVALKAAEEVLQPPLSIRRGAALLYEVTVDNNLALTVDPKNPVRGDSAFQTDLAFSKQSPTKSCYRALLLSSRPRSRRTTY